MNEQECDEWFVRAIEYDMRTSRLFPRAFAEAVKYGLKEDGHEDLLPKVEEIVETALHGMPKTRQVNDNEQLAQILSIKLHFNQMKLDEYKKEISDLGINHDPFEWDVFQARYKVLSQFRTIGTKVVINYNRLPEYAHSEMYELGFKKDKPEQVLYSTHIALLIDCVEPIRWADEIEQDFFLAHPPAHPPFGYLILDHKNSLGNSTTCVHRRFFDVVDKGPYAKYLEAVK